VRVAFVYPNPRRDLAAAVRDGLAPDTGLLGQNQLGDFGIEAVIHDSRLRQRTRLPGVAHRVTWLARELIVPWELRGTNAVVTSLGSVLPLAAKLRHGPKVVLININLCTSLQRLSGLRRRLLERSLAAADAIVCLAESQRSRLLEQVDLSPERVRVVHLGVDERFYTPQADPATPHVVAVGRDLGRDYATFAAAMRRISVRGTIVASARNLVGIDLPPNVDVQLDLTPVQLRELYASATCVAVPTHSQEFAHAADCSGQTVLLDAMAMGRPVVVTRRSTLDDYVRDRETAMYIPPSDVDALTSALRELIDRPELRQALGEQGRRSVERNFTTREFAAGLAPILKELA
jgi:glycosyltransferase involved in cell wall biosynthesis